MDPIETSAGIAPMRAACGAREDLDGHRCPRCCTCGCHIGLVAHPEECLCRTFARMERGYAALAADPERDGRRAARRDNPIR